MKFLLIALISLSSTFAMAQDMGVVAGFRSDAADAETAGAKTEGKTSYQLGGVAFFPVSEVLQVRTGFIYTRRLYEFKATSASSPINLTFTYFEIPAGLMYKFSDYGGAFIGPALAMNVSKDCGSATCNNVSSAPVMMQVGASFKFAPQLGAEIYYEMGLSKIADEVKAPKAVMANLLVTFD